MKITGLNGYTPLHDKITYYRVLKNARDSKPRPSQSGYFVHTGAMDANGKFYGGGNYEFAITDATHGEEAVVVAALNAKNPASIKIIGFPGLLHVPRHCGNCRDYMNAYSTPDLETITGNDNEILVMPYAKTFRKDDFKKIEPSKDDLRRFTLVKGFLDGTEMPYSKDRSSLYAVALTTPVGFIRASFEADVAYDPTLPLRHATLKLKYLAEAKSDLNIDLVTIVSEGSPQIPYKDRQQLMEFLDLHCKNNDVPIVLAHELPEKKGKRKSPALQFYKTSTQEWLPYPFAPSALLNEEELAEQRKRTLSKFK